MNFLSEGNELEADADARPYIGDIEVLSHREKEIEDIIENCQRLLHDMCEVEQGERTMVNETTAFFNNTLMKLESKGHSGPSAPRDMYKLSNNNNNRGKTSQVGTKMSLTSTRTLYYSNATRKTPAGTDFFKDGKPVVRLISSGVNNEEHKRSTMARTIGSPLSQSLYHTARTKTTRRTCASFLPPRSSTATSTPSLLGSLKTLPSSSIRFVEVISGFSTLRLPFNVICPRVKRVEDLDIDFEEEQIIPEFDRGTLSLTCAAEVSTELLNAVAYCTDLEDYQEILGNKDVLYNTFVLMILLEFSSFKNLFSVLVHTYDNNSETFSMEDLDAVLETLLNAIEDTDNRFLRMIHPTISSLPEDYFVRNLVFYVLLRFSLMCPHADGYYTACDFSDIASLFRHFRNDMSIPRIYSERLVKGLCLRMANEEEEEEENKKPLNTQLLVAMSTLGLYVRNLDLTMFDFKVTRPENIIRFFPLVEKVDLADTHISLSQLVRVFRQCTNLCEIRVTEFSVSSCRRIMAELKVKVINC